MQILLDSPMRVCLMAMLSPDITNSQHYDPSKPTLKASHKTKLFFLELPGEICIYPQASILFFKRNIF
ncbi:hypothetical protein SMMN14_06925 [Sphaerulina musiva]